MTTDRLYFRQLLAGRDFARTHPFAGQMANYTYVVGDASSREVVLVDPAYAPEELLAILSEERLTLVGVVATHYHADHIGGQLQGFSVPGIAEIVAVAPVPVHVHRDEVPWVQRGTGVTAPPVLAHDDGDVVMVGRVALTLVHTPGHTPGSQCVEVEGRLLSGDTLFLEGCGRTDLEGGDPIAMYDSLQRKLAALDGALEVYAGHGYDRVAHAPLVRVRETNPVLTPTAESSWLTRFGS